MSSAARILVVEDDAKIAALLHDYFSAAGFACECLADGRQAVARVETTAPALLVLDLMLPGMDGLEVCRAVRQFSSLPILMVTARVDEIDRLLGLELGADDYVCKPFSPREVVARVRAMLRRSEGRMLGTGGDSGFVIDEAGQRIRYQRQPLPLTALEFRLFRVLLRGAGRVFSRAQLLDFLHEDFRDISDRAIDSHIKNLRRKLEAVHPGAANITAVYGVGYRFDPVAVE